MAYVANDEIDDVLDDVIEGEESSTSNTPKEKDMTLINNYITDELFKQLKAEHKEDTPIYFTVKWLQNQDNVKNTIVRKKAHDMYFSQNDYDFKVLGTRYQVSNPPFGEQYCPWTTLSIQLWKIKQDFPNHAKFAKLDQAHKGMSTKDEAYTNIFIVDSNIPDVIGKSFKFKIPKKAVYEDFVLYKRKGINAKGKQGKKINVFAKDYIATTISVTKTGDSPRDREWSAIDDEDCEGQTFEMLLEGIGKTFDDVTTYDLKEFTFEGDSYVSEDLKADPKKYVEQQYEDAKKWIYYHVPELISYSKIKWIKDINGADYLDGSTENVLENEELEDADDYSFDDADTVELDTDDLDAMLDVSDSLDDDELAAIMNED